MKHFSLVTLFALESSAVRYHNGGKFSEVRDKFKTEQLQSFVNNFADAKLSRTDESKQKDANQAKRYDPTTMDPNALIFHSNLIVPDIDPTIFSVTASVVFQYRHTMYLDFKFKNIATGARRDEVKKVISDFVSAKKYLVKSSRIALEKELWTYPESKKPMKSLALMYQAVLANEVEMTVSLPKPFYKKIWFIILMFLVGISAIAIGLYFAFRKRS